MIVVMITGHVGCLKTSLSYLLAANFNLGHVSTSNFGKIDILGDEVEMQSQRSHRYMKAFSLCDMYLSMGTSIVVEATFDQSHYRQSIYDLAESHDVEDVICIFSFASDSKVVLDRLNWRKKFKNTPDSFSNSISNYTNSAATFHSISNDHFSKRPISRIDFDSGIIVSKVMNGKIELVQEISDFINMNETRSLLMNPLFYR
ncbi:MAG: hypothetical protein K1X54_11335 [Flavobacteriales bacterium]|nr:hypothetical protein [Flavobacteriales bacterium]